MDYRTRYQILNSRVNFAFFVQSRQLVDERRKLGIYVYSPTNNASLVQNLQIGALNTTLEEYNAYIAAVSPPAPAPVGGFFRSKGNTTAGGFTIGETVEKDMENENYTNEFNPINYYPSFFPGMSEFSDGNIVAGDKDDTDRLTASYWNDLGNDVFDDWGYFYIYDPSSGKYYFPLINPQNQDDSVFSTQTFSAFGRTFTIIHGWCVQGIFKFDISVADDLPFQFGAYGNMGSDGDEFTEDLTYTNANLTLYYHHHEENGDSLERLYSYFIPKKVSENNSQTYNAYYDSDNMSMISKQVTNGLIVYFAKSNDVKEWVANDIERI